MREEYKRGFGVPTLIAVHPVNDPEGKGLAQAKAYAAATGGDRAGVLESSFVAEVKSDLMGEQTILCGMLQTGSVLCFDHMMERGVDAGYASKLIQYGWETITEALKHGGITGMMDRLDNPSKLKAFDLSEELKGIMRPLYVKHQDDIISGAFSSGMMADWDAGDSNLLKWRAETAETNFEKTPARAPRGRVPTFSSRTPFPNLRGAISEREVRPGPAAHPTRRRGPWTSPSRSTSTTASSWSPWSRRASSWRSSR